MPNYWTSSTSWSSISTDIFAEPPRDKKSRMVGLNLPYVEFTNRMLHAKPAGRFENIRTPWRSMTLGGGYDDRPIVTTDMGLPDFLAEGQIAECLIPVDRGQHYSYTAIGPGFLEFVGAEDYRDKSTFVARSDWVRVRVSSSSFGKQPLIKLTVSRTHGNKPGYEFTKETMNELAPFGVVRMVGPGRINEVTPTIWQQRTWPTTISQTTDDYSGIAFEHMRDIASLSGAFMWWNIPYQVNDKFVEEFGRFLQKTQRECYVEYSNENWKFGLPQRGHCERRAMELGINLVTDPQAAFKYSVRRSAQIMKIIGRVFPHVISVVTVPFWDDVALKHLLNSPDLTAHKAIGFAPVFTLRFDRDQTLLGTMLGIYDKSGVQAASDWFLDQLEKVELPAVIQRIRDICDAIRTSGTAKHPMAYNAGFEFPTIHGFQLDRRITYLTQHVMMNPRLGRLLARLLDVWKTESGVMPILLSGIESVTFPRDYSVQRNSVQEWINKNV